MPFDGITTACVTRELSGLLVGAKVEKIHQPAPEELILLLHGNRTNVKLLISAASAHARIHLIEQNVANPPNPPGFCMLLRKHIQNGRIRDFSQKDSERIVEICVDSLDEMGYSVHKKLIIEIMGKHSNISLVDIDTGKILDSIKRISGDVNRYRQLLPGALYVYPPVKDKAPVWTLSNADKMKERFEYQEASDKILDFTLQPTFHDLCEQKIASVFVGRLQGVSPFLASAVCEIAGVSPQTVLGALSESEYQELFTAFSQILKKVDSHMYDNVVYCDPDGMPVDFYPIDLAQALQAAQGSSCASALNGLGRLAGAHVKSFDTLSAALEYYYESKASSSHIRQKAADLIKVVQTVLDKLYLKRKRLLADLEDASGNDRIRLLGELLTAGIYKVKQGDTSFEADNYYDGGTVSIPLDPLLSPSENIQRYFKKYNKAKTAMKEKNIQLTETNADISYLESVLTFMENTQDAGDLTDLRQELIENRYIRKKRSKNGLSKKDKPEKSGLKPYAYTTSDGFRLSVGRNNKQNDILTLKTASNKDLWFHTKEIPGSHVILFTEGKEPSETALREAASLAAWHSKARQSDNVPVDFAAVKHVRKPAGAKYGMVIYDHHQTLYVKPSVPDAQ